MAQGRVTISLLDPMLATRPMLAMSLQAAWYWGDPPLRAALEASIRSLVQRTPEMLPVLKATLNVYQPPRHAWLDGASELAGLLLTLWALGDEQLRTEAEEMIPAYAQRQPAFGSDFQALARAALDDQRVVQAFAEQRAASARLRGLIGQLEETG
jgi:hypothetical protein